MGLYSSHIRVVYTTNLVVFTLVPNFALSTTRKNVILMNKKFTKSADKMLAGVCGGIADYCDIDSTVVRVAYTLTTCLTGFLPAVILYVILALSMPQSDFE